MSASKNQSLITLGLRIKQLRAAKKISQEKLALASNIDSSYVGRIERGESNPTYLMLCAIAKTLEVSVKDVISNVD
jgi:transcriptional regulator with XRE-family HTH domain